MTSKKLCIIGAGLAGATMANLLKDHFHKIVLLEKDFRIGGLCKSQYVGTQYKMDINGGHIFNTKNKRVKEFVFDKMNESQWRQIDRNAKIFIEGKLIGWPFEYNMWEFGKKFANKCIKEMGGSESLNVADLELYLINRFGKTACDKYHFKYSKKIWDTPLDNIGINWVASHKTPIGNKEEVLKRNKSKIGDDYNMTHSSFYYPRNKNGIAPLIESILNQLHPLQLRIETEYYPQSIKKGFVDNWPFDVIVNTAPINDLLSYMGQKSIQGLLTHGTDFCICKTDFFKKHPEITWAYVPDDHFDFYRVTNIAKLNGADDGIALIEFPYGKATEHFNFSPYNVEVIDIFSIRRTYPIPPLPNVATELEETIESLKKQNIYTCGRWGLHSYDNMDVVIEKCLNVADEIIRCVK